MRTALLSLVFAFGLGLVAGCDQVGERIIIPRCEIDGDCAVGEVCVDGACVPRQAAACNEIEGGQSILQPATPVVDFQFVGSGTSQRELVLRNIGDCTLTVFEAYLDREEESPFECPNCAPDQFPIELFPFREHRLTVFFTPEGVGDYEDQIVLLSDDGEYQEIRVPVRARFNGVPEAAFAPNEIDFDYTPVGRTTLRTLRLTNRGTGIAPLEILSMEIETATASAFSFEPEIVDPISLTPVTVDAESQTIVNLRYHPQEIASHVGTLLVVTNQPDEAVLRIPLQGSSQTPAKIAVSPESVDFGPVPIGQTTSLPLTIVNEGGTTLRVAHSWGGIGLSTDLSLFPQAIPPIAPGSFTEIQVLVTATSPTPITGLLLLESNDPSRPSITIPVSAEGQDVVGAQVIKLDMSYENGADSAFDDDFRNVDMTLENPFGLIVNEQEPQPTNWNNFGNPSWIGFGPKKEPERIVLPDAMQDGTYRVLLSYQEDCSTVPSGLVAAILGIAVQALAGLPSNQISDAIQSICLRRRSTAATVTVFLNGQVVAEVPATLGQRGDTIYALDLIRSSGMFTVVY